MAIIILRNSRSWKILLYYEIEARKPERIGVKEAIGLHIAKTICTIAFGIMALVLEETKNNMRNNIFELSV